MILKRTCPMCRKVNQVTVDPEAYRTWMAGANVQDVFPLHSANDRELIKTGICAKCWDDMFEDVD